jgi:hypothetical protein
VPAVAALLLGGCGGSSPPPPENTTLPPRLPDSTGQRFYVSPQGSDSAAGSSAEPWRTVQKAFDTLRPGQIALVRAGTYRENVVVRRGGTARAPVTVRNEPGARPVLTPAPRSPSYPLRLTDGAAYVRVQGFVVERARGPSTMNVVGLGESPGAHDYEISDCEIRFARNSSGIFVDDTNRRVWLLGNTVHDNNERGVQHQGIYFEGHDSVIANNVVYGQTDGFGIQVRAGADNVVVTHNTVSGNSLSGIVVENTAARVRVVNNVSAFNGGYAVRGLDAGGPLGSGNVADDNLGFRNGDGEFANEGRRVLHFSRGNLVRNPKFVDRAQGDFRLGEGSPALDRAVPEWSPAQDRSGAPRPSDVPADLGAYERR